MDWLSQNWIWIAVAIGGVFLFSRMGVGGCGIGTCGMGRSMGGSRGNGINGPPVERGTGPGNTFDPVSQHPLPAGAAISSVYQGRAYYFESRENRDAFESDPEKYLAASPKVGQALTSEAASSGRPPWRSGCC